MSDKLFQEYLHERRTLRELARDRGRSIKWVQQQIRSYEPEELEVKPGSIVFIADATYWGSRKDGFGTLVFLDCTHNLVVASRHFPGTERKADYLRLKRRILVQGFKIQAVVIDGRKGLRELFSSYPVQYCQFHQQQRITRYLTLNPKSEAAIDLKRICSYMTRCTEARFSWLLDAWHGRHQDYLNEKKEDDSKRGWHYTHKRLRSAYFSLRRNTPWLFTYRKYPEFSIPNTTNPLDGGVFAPMKNLINLHAGISKSLKVKMIDDFLVQHNKKNLSASKKFH